MPDDELKKEALEYYQHENWVRGTGWSVIVWAFTGLGLFLLNQFWIFTWWGFCFVGLPYLIGLVWLANYLYKLSREAR